MYRQLEQWKRVEVGSRGRGGKNNWLEEGKKRSDKGRKRHTVRICLQGLSLRKG